MDKQFDKRKRNTERFLYFEFALLNREKTVTNWNIVSKPNLKIRLLKFLIFLF